MNLRVVVILVVQILAKWLLEKKDFCLRQGREGTFRGLLTYALGGAGYHQTGVET